MKIKFFTILILALLASLTLVSGASAAEWTIENATEAFQTSVVLPENAAQYKRELSIQLTDEQAATFEKGGVFIYVPNVSAIDETAIQAICNLPVELTDDHRLKVEFSGLYASVREDSSEILSSQLVTTRPILMSRQDSLEDDKAFLSMLGVFYGELDVMYDNFVICIDYLNNTAQIESISLSEATTEPLNGYYSAFRYTYVMDEGAELPNLLDMTPTACTMWYEKKIEEPRTIVMRPVSGSGCMILFSVTNTDGTRYSLAPVSYD